MEDHAVGHVRAELGLEEPHVEAGVSRGAFYAYRTALPSKYPALFDVARDGLLQFLKDFRQGFCNLKFRTGQDMISRKATGREETGHPAKSCLVP